MNTEPYSTWWLHNDDFSIWYLFHKIHNCDVRIKEYRRRLYNKADIQGCPLEPSTGGNRQYTLNKARDQWTKFTRAGFRMLTHDIGMLEIRDDYETVWLTLNKSRSKSNNSKYALEA